MNEILTECQLSYNEGKDSISVSLSQDMIDNYLKDQSVFAVAVALPTFTGIFIPFFKTHINEANNSQEQKARLNTLQVYLSNFCEAYGFATEKLNIPFPCQISPSQMVFDWIKEGERLENRIDITANIHLPILGERNIKIQGGGKIKSKRLIRDLYVIKFDLLKHPPIVATLCHPSTNTVINGLVLGNDLLSEISVCLLKDRLQAKDADD